MGKVILEGYIDVPSTDLAQVVQALPTHIALTREEPGCLVFNVEQSHNNHGVFHVYEVFENQAMFESHQARVKASAWGALTEHVKRHYTITKP